MIDQLSAALFGSALTLESLAVLAAEPIQNGDAFGDEATVEWTRVALLGILGYGLLAGASALALSGGYRAVTARELPVGGAVLFGLAPPAGWLSYRAVVHGEVVADSPLVHYTSGLFLLGVVAAGTVAAVGGRRLGDHLACGALGVRRVDAAGSVADLVRSAGLSVTLSLPDSIDDAEGYPSVDEGVKRDLAGRRLRFPNDCSPTELRARLERRLEVDFGIGYVSAELSAAGDVETLTVGGRRDGIGPTLGPNCVAVAVAADPPSKASAGDPVEVWTTGSESTQYVATGTLRASTDSTVTLVVDADDADSLTAGGRYRLTTRPAEPSTGYALVAAIRSADETVAVRTVESDGPLESEFAGWVPGTVLAIGRGEDVLSLPADNEPLEAGDTLYVFGTPDQLDGPVGEPASDSPGDTAVDEGQAA
ncbi:cation:proton antiporter regulatory subunit [Natronolimnohabitans innermongolicus]|uniref:RCK C-terminal domain-containing protein n=1 Tax=Natronolimnohabitans innermongolicus JCM 12255 TaxID=1227499 RepID=L9X4Q7_9EURY|nr:TrkA C-terminal domain-containing protein [Natronolimnohabitans innermongolicus]ELY56690.1 hypothetical protein C493_09960 [Natronolimnohabitans innermongolicus JCM 12255]